VVLARERAGKPIWPLIYSVNATGPLRERYRLTKRTLQIHQASTAVLTGLAWLQPLGWPGRRDRGPGGRDARVIPPVPDRAACAGSGRGRMPGAKGAGLQTRNGPPLTGRAALHMELHMGSTGTASSFAGPTRRPCRASVTPAGPSPSPSLSPNRLSSRRARSARWSGSAALRRWPHPWLRRRFPSSQCRRGTRARSSARWPCSARRPR